MSTFRTKVSASPLYARGARPRHQSRRGQPPQHRHPRRTRCLRRSPSTEWRRRPVCGVHVKWHQRNGIVLGSIETHSTKDSGINGRRGARSRRQPTSSEGVRVSTPHPAPAPTAGQHEGATAMTTTTTIPEITGDTPEAIDRTFKAAWEAMTPSGARQPEKAVADALREAQRKAHEALTAAAKKASKSNGDGHRAPKTPDGATFSKNGKPLARHSLSFAAWATTKGIGDENVERIGVVDLRAILVKAGVAEPETTTFAVKLPNGVVLSAEMPGQAFNAAQKALIAEAAKAPQKAAGASKKATAPKSAATPSKAPAKATTAKKATSASKAPAARKSA